MKTALVAFTLVMIVGGPLFVGWLVRKIEERDRKRRKRNIDRLYRR